MRKPFMVLPWALAVVLLLQTAAGSNQNDDDITFDDVPTRPEGPGRPPNSNTGGFLYRVYSRVKRGWFDFLESDSSTTTTPEPKSSVVEDTTPLPTGTVSPLTSVSSSHREIRSTLSGEGTTSSDRFRVTDDEDLGTSSGSGAEWSDNAHRHNVPAESDKYTVFRIKMHVQEFWVKDYKDKRSLTYENFVKNFTSALVSFFDEKTSGDKPLLPGKRHATVIGIEPSDDSMLIHVTADLGSKGTSNEEEKTIKEQLTKTVNELGRLGPFTVQVDASHPLSIQRFTVPSPTGNSPCEAHELVCNDGTTCLPMSTRCNGTNECLDGTDEDGCPELLPPTENPNEIDGTLSRSLARCDDIRHCPDGVTEICASLICDGIQQCPGESEEQDCATESAEHVTIEIPSFPTAGTTTPSTSTAEDFNCLTGEFMCDIYRCIPASNRCDGNQDCDDGTDEDIDCPSKSCRSNQFQCTDGKCIDIQLKCDGQPDCANGSDETDCDKPCEGDDFKCSNGTCIPSNLKCNGAKDCPGGEDEKGPECPIETTGCMSAEFSCKNGQCVHKQFMCDTINDCVDGSDEDESLCEAASCLTTDFRCQDTNKCVRREFVCDGTNNCQDGSDEIDCPSSSCSYKQYECESGQCIQASERCNGHVDCNDGSDERDCQTPACSPYTQFTCNNGDCVNRSAKCNKVEDCTDGSDEHNCILNEIQLMTNPSSQEIHEGKEAVFQCRDEGPSRYRVGWSRRDGLELPYGSRFLNNGARLEIPNVQMSATGAYVCEALGAPRNAEGAQTTVHLKVLPEITVPYHLPDIVTCRYDEATCYNRQCIPKNKVCDGHVDCGDGSDESRCGGTTCEANMFMCNNRECIIKTWRCDNQKDCLDGSDEEDCEVFKNGTCYSTEFACKSGDQCIPKGMVCDKQKDCADNSDEIGCMDPEIIEPPQPIVTLEPGEQLILRCRAIGFPIPIINWRLNWGHVPKKCSMSSHEGLGTLDCPDIRYEDSGAYSCEAISVKSKFAIPDANVIVKQRPQCSAGYFNDQARHPSECLPCFCFGKTSNCRSAVVSSIRTPVPAEPFQLILVSVDQEIVINALQNSPIQSYMSSLENGFQISSRFGGNSSQYSYYSVSDEIFRPRYRYPTSPIPIPYGGAITYRVKPGGDTRRPYIDIPDIIIAGNNRTLSYKLETPLVRDRENDVSIMLTEGNWKITHPQEGRYNDDARREDIMMVLVNIDHILIRVQYIEGLGVETAITDIIIDTVGNSSSEGVRTPFVEQCSCPEGYTGLSCEECARDYIRQPGNYLGNCVKDEKCPSGTYGAPERGIKCRRCPCPTAYYPGSYSTCTLGPQDQPICDCRTGYVGEQCERCDSYHGYEGDARIGDCRIPESVCSPNGSYSLTPSSDGKCSCKPFATGTYCDECIKGSFFLSSNNQYGCISCFCMGTTKECSSSTLYRDVIETQFDGRSTNNFNIFRKTSDERTDDDRKQPRTDPSSRELYYDEFDAEVYYWELPGNYLFDKVTSYGGNLTYTIRYTPSPGGMSSKNSAPDVEIISPNKITLYHYSKQNIEPEQTVTVTVPLLEQYWQGEYGQQTDREHLLQALADISGIYIKATYTTSTSRASLSYVSLDTTSESNTGLRKALEVEQCQCLSGYKGTSCEDCAPGYKRAEDGLYLGICEPCDCGGYSDDCDPETGVCRNCRDNRAGDKCQDCAENFVLSQDGECRPTSTCSCDERFTRTCHNNRCICKGNVVGESCNRCRPGTFHLSTDNEFGCEECYCSGVANTCYSSSLFMESVPVPILDDNHGYSLSDGSRVIIREGFVPDIAVSELGYPVNGRQNRLFWSLPSRLTGDKILSYGGSLAFTHRYTTDNTDSEPTQDHDIIISGNGRSIFYVFDEPLGPIEPRSEIVKISAGKWRVMDSSSGNPTASRHDILKVLSNVDHILIRASLARDIQYTYISDVSLETASQNSYDQQPAEQIELCRCPPEYTGTSCQNCAEDHYRDSNNRCVKCPCVNGRGCVLINDQDIKCNCDPGWQGSLCDVPATPPSESNGEAPSPSIRMNVSVSPDYVPEGSRVTLTCTAETPSGDPVERIIWSREGGNIPSRAYDDRRGRLTINDVVVSDSGVYRCSARTRDTIETEAAILVVNAARNRPPVITISPSTSIEVLEGSEINVKCEADGYPLPSIEWHRVDGRAFNVENDNQDGQIRISSGSKSDEGQYECVASNAAGSDRVYMDILVREIAGNVFVSPRDTTVWPGQTVTLRCALERPSDSVQFQWSRNDRRQFPGGAREDNGILTIPNIQPRDAGEYLCTATRVSDGHKVSEAKGYITVHPIRPVPLSVNVSPRRLSVNEGDSVTFRCASSSPDAALQWSRLRGDLPRRAQVNDGLLVIHNVVKSDTAVYRCDAIIGSSAAAGTVHLEVKRRGVAPVIELSQRNVILLEGNSHFAECRAQGSQSMVRWSRRNGPLPSNVVQERNLIRFHTVTLNDADEYVCTAENSAGRTSAALLLEVHTRPKIRTDPNDEYVEKTVGESLRLICRATGVPAPLVKWEITSRSTSRYTSNTVGETGQAVFEIRSLSPEDDGTYTCTAYSAAGTIHKSIRIRVIDNNVEPGEPVRKNFEVELGGSTRIDCVHPSSDLTFEWERMDGAPLGRSVSASGSLLLISNAEMSDAGDYVCKITDRNGVPQPGSIASLSVVERFNIRLRPESQVVYPGDNAFITCEVIGNRPADITWQGVRRDLPISASVVDGRITFNRITQADAGMYSCIAVDRETNYRVTSTARVTVKQHTSDVLRVARVGDENINITEGAATTLQCTTNIPNARISWEKQGLSTLPPHMDIGQGGHDLILKTVYPQDSGTYICRAHSPNGGSGSSHFNLYVYRCSGSGKKACKDGKKCLSISQFCNGINDCLDRSDELMCSRRKRNNGALAPRVSIEPSVDRIRVGETVDLRCNSVGVFGMDQTTWEKVGERIADNVDVNDKILRIQEVTPENAGLYRCWVRNQNDQVVEDIYKLEVQGDSPPSTEPPRKHTSVKRLAEKTKTATVYDPVDIECDTGLEPPVNFIWTRRNGQLLVNQTGPTIHLSHVLSSDAGEYLCIASNGEVKIEFPTFLIVKGTIPRFAQQSKSYLKLKPMAGAGYMKFDLVLSVKPERPNGLILYNGEKNSKRDFLAIGLRNGRVEFRFDVGSGEAIISSNFSLPMGKWSNITVRRERKEGRLFVNELGPFIGTSPGRYQGLDLSEPMYLGSVPDFSSISPSAGFSTGFVGCISFLKINDRVEELMKALEKSEITECNTCSESQCRNNGVCQEYPNERGYQCLCPRGFTGDDCQATGGTSACYSGLCNEGKCVNTPGSYRCQCRLGTAGENCELKAKVATPFFKGESFLAYPIPHATHDLSLQLDIKLEDNGNALLAYAGQSYNGNGNFVALLIRDQQIEFTVEAGSGPETIRNPHRLTSGSWIKIRANKKAEELSLTVNGDRSDKMLDARKSRGYKKVLNLHTPLYIGGYDDTSISLHPSIYIKDGFRGCVSLLRINDRPPTHLIKSAVESSNIEQCPGSEFYNRDDTTELCGDKNCQNGGYCDYSEGAPTCKCTSDFGGRSCEINTNKCGQNPNPCGSNGVCLPEKNAPEGFRCDCFFGFTGSTCQDRTTISTDVTFRRDSYVELPGRLTQQLEAEDEIAISMTIQTEEPIGLLFWQGNDLQYMSIGVRDGLVVAEVDHNDNPLTLRSRDRVDDALPHNLTVILKASELEITLDGITVATTNGQPPRQMSSKESIFIGGIPDTWTTTNGRWTETFVGCVVRLRINSDEPIDFSQVHVSSRNVRSCPSTFRSNRATFGFLLNNETK